jgi:hypothetical protein
LQVVDVVVVLAVVVLAVVVQLISQVRKNLTIALAKIPDTCCEHIETRMAL